MNDPGSKPNCPGLFMLFAFLILVFKFSLIEVGMLLLILKINSFFENRKSVPKRIKKIKDTINIIKYFLIIGLLGSFTTFSAFSFEVLDLIISKKYVSSFTYIFISIFICIISAYLGTLLNKL